MSVWFHGTTKENAKVILADGFKVGTFFGQHLEDALHMGGDYIFEVWFDEKPTDYWEYVARERIPPERIRYLYSIVPTLLHENPTLERHIKGTHLREDHPDHPEFTVCATCDGRGQMEHYPPFARWRDREKITACPDCGGYGSVEKKQWMDSQTFPPPTPEQAGEMREAEVLDYEQGKMDGAHGCPPRTLLPGPYLDGYHAVAGLSAAEVEI